MKNEKCWNIHLDLDKKKQAHEQYVFKLLCWPTITVVLVIDPHPESLPVVISQHYHHYTPLLLNSICFWPCEWVSHCQKTTTTTCLWTKTCWGSLHTHVKHHITLARNNLTNVTWARDQHNFFGDLMKSTTKIVKWIYGMFFSCFR